jgi:hypothetical protein
MILFVVRGLAITACLLLGCDRVFGLQTLALGDGALADTDAATDFDHDLVFDDVDNCRMVPNPDQHDEDRDEVGDVCDNCPHVANYDQDNTDNDGLGEACDDSAAIDCIVRFDPFTNPISPSPQGSWMVADDAVVQLDVGAINAFLAVDGSNRQDPLILTHVRVQGFGAPTDYNNFGIWGEATVAETTPGVPDTGFLAEVVRTTILPSDNMAGIHVSKHVNATTVTNSQLVRFAPTQMMTTSSSAYVRLDMRGGTMLRSAALLDNGAELVVSSTITAIPAGRVGFRTYRLSAAYDYVVIVERRSVIPCPARN